MMLYFPENSTRPVDSLPLPQAGHQEVLPADTAVYNPTTGLTRADTVITHANREPLLTSQVPILPAAATALPDTAVADPVAAEGPGVNWDMEFTLFNHLETFAPGQVSESLFAPSMVANADTAWLLPRESPAILPANIVAPQEVATTDEPHSQAVETESTGAVLQSDWFLALIVASVVVTGVVKNAWGKYLDDLFKSFIFTSYAARLATTNASNLQPSFLLSSLFFFNMSLFVFQATRYLGITWPGLANPLILLSILGGLVIIFNLKVLTYKLAGNIFGTSRQINQFLAGGYLMAKIYGLLLTPLLVFIPFVPPNIQVVLITLGAGLFALMYLLQIARGFANNLTSPGSLYYLILYFCALEIIPLTLLFKVLFR